MLYKLLLPSFLYIFGWTEFAFLLWHKPRLLETETLFDAPVFKQKYSDHTHTHPFNGPFSGTTQVSRYQKGKTSLDFTEARDSE